MNKQKIIIISAVVGFLFIFLVIYYLIPRSYIKFETAPNNVGVLIDSEDRYSIKNGDTITINPGKHTISVFQDEFITYEKKIDIKNKQTYDFIIALTPITNNAKKLLNNKASDIVLERYYGEIMTKQTEELEKNYPILDVLPLYGRAYEIMACPSVKYPRSSIKLGICINTSEPGIESFARDNIIQHGYNPDDYEIIYKYTPISN